MKTDKTNKNAENVTQIIIAPKVMYADEEFFFGNNMASSNCPVDIITKIETILAYSAKSPNSSGVYSLDKIGVIKKGITCAMPPPDSSVKTSVRFLFFLKSLLINNQIPFSSVLQQGMVQSCLIFKYDEKKYLLLHLR